MKKGWKKRLLNSGFKPDWSIGYGEFLFQNFIWGVVILGSLWVIARYFVQSIPYSFSDFMILLTAGLAGGSTAYYFKHKKKK